jgi:drug/metabolite transporter (DMT)-like permease
MAIRIVVMHMPPLRSVSLRLLLGSAVLIPFMLLRKARWPVGKEWGLLFVFSTLMLAVSFSLVAWAIQRLPTGTTSLLFATSPLLTAWLEPWLSGRSQRTHTSPMVILGMLGGLGGVALVLSNSTLAGFHLPIDSVVAVLFVVLFGSMATIIAKRLLKNIPVLTISTVETMMAGAFLGAVSLGMDRNQPTVWTSQVILAMLFLGIFSSALGFLLYYWLLMQIEPHLLQARYLIMPIVAMTDGYLFLHEHISPAMILGACAVLGSLALVLMAEARASRAVSNGLEPADKKC